MGGVQSQESCDKDSPKYSYHERVLQDAEATSSDDQMTPTEAVKGDEQYYSAEEGDSMCSLTPERTRPESTSAENSSDTSDDHDTDDDDYDTINENTIRDEAHESSMFEDESLVIVGTHKESHENSYNTVQGKTHGNSDVNKLCASLVSLEDKSRCSHDAGCSNTDNTACQKNLTHPTAVLNPTSQELHLVKTSSDSNQYVANCDESSQFEKLLLPVDNMSATSSFKRKRCKHQMSSESESDDGKKERHINVCKERKKSSHYNRSRRIHRSFRKRRDSTSDSDELEYERRNNSKRFMCACYSKSEESAGERECRKYRGKCVNQKCKQQICQRSVDRQAYDNNVATSAENSSCHNIKNIQRHAVESGFAVEDEIESMQDGRCVHNCNQGDSNAHVYEQQTKQHAAVPNLAEVNVLNCDTHSSSVRDNVFSQHGYTLTMEEQSLDNTNYDRQARQQNNGTLITSTLPNRQVSGSDPFQSDVNVNNAPSKGQCSHGDFISEPENTALLNQRLHAKVDTFENAPVLIGQSSNHEGQSASETNFRAFMPAQEDVGLSTLTNLSTQNNAAFSTTTNVSTQNNTALSTRSVSTPESKGSGLARHTETVRIAGSSYTAEPPLESPLQKTTNRFCQNRKQECQNKYKENTTANKFMNLFSSAKKEIESNIKSLISKVTFTDKLPKSSQPYWQTYLSESSSTNKACSGFSSAQKTYMETSTRQQCVGVQKTQGNSSLINQEPPYKIQSTVDNTILDSPSYSNYGESSVTSLAAQHNHRFVQSTPPEVAAQHNHRYVHSTPPEVAAQHNHRYVHSTPPEVATHPDNVKGCKQNLVLTSSGAALFQNIINNCADSLNKSPLRHTRSIEWLPQASEHQVLNCSLAGAICMSVWVGDLGEQKTSGIVNWTDGALTHSVTRCSKSIASKAGALMWASCADYIDNKGGDLEAPDVLTTPAGGRFDKSVVAILHVVEPRLVGDDESGNTSALVEVYVNCLRFANERLGLDSISFPLIGDSTFPFDICMQSFFDAVLIFLAEQTSSENSDLTSIQLIFPDVNTASFAADLLNSYLQNIGNNDLYSIARNTYNHHFGNRKTEGKVMC